MMWYPLRSLHCALRVWGAPRERVKASTYSSKVWAWKNLNIYVPALLRNRNSRSIGQWEEGRGEKNSTWERAEKGRGLPQAPEHPTTGLRAAGCKLQTKGSNAKQLLSFIVLPLLFVCWLWTAVQMLLCWVQGWGGGNAGVALCSAGCLAPREQRRPALAKVYPQDWTIAKSQKSGLRQKWQQVNWTEIEPEGQR